MPLKKSDYEKEIIQVFNVKKKLGLGSLTKYAYNKEEFLTNILNNKQDLNEEYNNMLLEYKKILKDEKVLN